MSAAVSQAGSADPRLLMRAARMSRTQQAAVAVTFALSALDGFDVLAATLAAPALVRAWGIDPARLGLMLSAGLAGMALGSLLLGPLADAIGRRNMVFASLGLMGGGMALSGLADGVATLSLWRLVTGLGIGAMVSVINPIATEFASDRRRDLAVSLMAIGYPVGGVVGGAAAALLLRSYDWPVIFFVGAGLALLMLPVAWIWLPESLSFLIERPRAHSLASANRLLARCGLPAVERLPEPVAAGGGKPFAALFAPAARAALVPVTLINLLYIVPVYYVLSWVPQLVAERGFSSSEAASVSLLLNLAGIAGGVAFGWAGAHASARRLSIGVFLAFAALTAMFAYAPADLAALRLSGAVLGFFLFAGMCALHALISRSFPDHIRASGAGFVLGIGRVGSAVAPALAGLLFSLGAGRGGVSLAIGACAALSALILLFARKAGQVD